MERKAKKILRDGHDLVGLFSFSFIRYVRERRPPLQTFRRRFITARNSFSGPSIEFLVNKYRGTFAISLSTVSRTTRTLFLADGTIATRTNFLFVQGQQGSLEG
jgi:hypothetical protein